MSTEDKFTQITLRMPKALHARLRAYAASRSHSMNAEIIQRLEKSLPVPGEQNIRGAFDAVQKGESTGVTFRIEFDEDGRGWLVPQQETQPDNSTAPRRGPGSPE